MRYLLSSIFIFLIALLHWESLSAATDNKALCGKIQSCMDAENPLTITGYMCTKWDFVAETLRPISRDDTAYIVVMSVKFQEIDDAIMKHMKDLEAQRNTDGLSWIEYINTKILPISKQYAQTCTRLWWDLWILQECAVENKTAPPSISGFPQTICNDLAEKKTRAWENMAYILASKWIAKWFQNSKDIHLDRIKGKYSKLLDAFISYSTLLSSAVKKLDAYIKDPL